MPVRIGKKLYKTVHERLTAAHGDTVLPEGITSILSDVRPAGEAVVVVSTVTFTDGRSFTGISQARFDATSGADATNPVECAETSAVGRALAMAGYFGSDDGLAGAEEVRDATRRQNAPRPAQEKQTAKDSPRAWYERTAPIAQRDYGYRRIAFADDAPDDYILAECQKLKTFLAAQMKPGGVRL